MQPFFAINISQELVEDIKKYYKIEEPDIAFMCALEDILERKTSNKVTSRDLVAISGGHCGRLKRERSSAVWIRKQLLFC